MPLEATNLPAVAPRAGVRLREPQIVFATGADGGTLTVSSKFAALFARAGLTSASAFLDLPGEVVSGHSDRHVMRVTVPGAAHALYLKRQHVVGWREKVRNWRAGFGWVSRCEREAALLRELETAKLHAPRMAASGAVGGRAFLLVEEVPGAVNLRRILSDGTLSAARRRMLAENIASALAQVHACGVSTPDLTAKHILVHPNLLAITFIDWQSARHGLVSEADRIDALGALHASLAPALASGAERMRMFRTYITRSALSPPRIEDKLPRSGGPPYARSVLRAASRHATRRSVRDQLQPTEPSTQRLVWLAGEAVCAVPEIAAQWPRRAIVPPFYGFGPDGASVVQFAGRDAVLIRGHTSAPIGRFGAWLRAAPWRSPGVTIGRVLFHLERYGVPAPRSLAFGQRLTSATAADWFALYEAGPGVALRTWRRTASAAARRELLGAVTDCLRRLHEAGCVLTDPKAAFAVCDGAVSIADPRAVRIVRKVSESARVGDLRSVTRLMGVE